MARKVVQLLRNSALYDTKALAITGLNDLMSNSEAAVKDGEAVLARYYENNGKANNKIKTLLAVVHKPEGGAATYTLYEDGIPADVQTALNAIQSELDATQTGSGLDATGAYVKDTTEGSLIADATSLANADVKLAAALKQEIADREKAITDLDVTDVVVTGKVVKSVSETDGKITVSRDFLADTDVKIASVIGTELAGLGSNVKEAYKLVNGDETPVRLGEYIKIYKDQTLKEIKLVDEWYEKDGKTVEAGTEGAEKKEGQGLKYTYFLASGVEESVTVDVSTFLVQSEFKNGLEVNAAGEVSVKVDAASEKVTTAEGVQSEVLSVSEDGVKISNIQAAINYAVTSKNADAEGDDYVSATAANNKVSIETNVVKMADVKNDTKALADVKDVKDYVDAAAAKATTVVSGESAVSGPAVKVTVKIPADADGHVEYVVAGQDLASAATLTTVNGADTVEGSFRKAVKDAKEAIEGTLVEGDAKTLEAINAELNGLDAAVAAAKTVVKDAVASQKFVTVTKAEKVVGETFDTYTVAVNDIASDAELTNVETAVGLAADGTLAAISNKNYINGSASVMAAVEALDGALKTADDAMLTGVAQGYGIEVTTKNNKSQTIKAKAVANDPVIEVTANGIGSKADAVWECGTY